MKNVILLLPLLLFCNILFAQDLKIVHIPRGAQAVSTTVIDGVTTHNYSSGKSIPVNGIPFLNEQFTPGILELHDGKKSDEVLLRYDISKDLFEISRNNDTLTLNRPYDVKYVYLEDKVFIFDPNFRENTQRKYNGFFELCISGELSLYKKWMKDLSFDSFASNYQGGSGTKEYYYVDKVGFVGKTNEGKPFLMNSSKNFLKNIDNYKSEMKAFIKENKIKFKKEEDLIELVDYYNTL